MITLNASGGSITFEFSGNSTYLNDGTITVPVNSLALIIDESDMATFKKAASNDIFVSANVSEFGMTKAELESWFKENAVGSTGGGSITVDSALDSGSTNPVQNQALYGELRVGGGTSKVEIDFNTGGYVPEGVTQLEVNPTTTDSWAAYNFYNGNTRLGYYNFTNWGSFNVGNSLEGSSYVISGETVIITYPASLGVTRIAQDGGNAPWSFEAIVETPAVPLKDVVSGKADSSAVTEEISAAVSGKQDTLIFDDTLKYNKVDDDKLGVYVKIAGGLYGNKKMYGNDTATLDIATIFAPRYANLNFNSSYTGTFDGTNALVVTYYDRNEGEESTSSITWDYSNGNYTTTASTSLVQLTTNPNYLNVYFLSPAYRIVKIEHKGLIASLYNQDEAGYYLNSVEFPVDYDDLNSFVKNVLARLTALENNS